jgi:hypothetical protein
MPSAIPTDTVTRNEVDELKSELRRLADSADEALRPQVRDAALDLIAAINYDDKTLMDSCFNSLLVGMADMARNYIPKDLSAAKGVKEGFKKAWEKFINKKAYDIAIFEDIKDVVESMIDARIASMSRGRKMVALLGELGQQIENAKLLEDGIRDLRKFREDVLKGWPSRKPPSSIDRTAIAQAREAIARGEKGMRKSDLVYPSEK